MSLTPDTIVITAAARTPMGSFQGELSSQAAHDLGGAAIAEAVRRAGVAPEKIDEVLMGNCLMAGQGQAPARQAAFKGGLPDSAGAVTLSKMCGAGMKAVMFAHDMLKVGTWDVMVAGGMESMSNAPYVLTQARGGYRIGNNKIFDHMMLDGLEDAYNPGQPMGVFGEQCAQKYGFTREQQDAFATESVQRAQAAVANGAFDAEIAPVTLKTRAGEQTINKDEAPGKVKIDKIPTLRPAFAKDGTVTAATSSSISDGASALVLMRAETAEQLGSKPLARIVAHATHSHAPEWFTTAPVDAAKKVLAKAGWNKDDVDLWEVNEAFAAVTMAFMHDMGVGHDITNVNGGACALGHPIGASGARIITTLIYALQARGLKRGVAALCIGGGEATAVAIELV